MSIKKMLISPIVLSMSILSVLPVRLPEFYNRSLDIPISAISKSDVINIYDENMPKRINRVVIFGSSILNDTNVMNIRESRFTLVLIAADTIKNASGQMNHDSIGTTVKIKTVFSDNPPTYIKPLYRKNINPGLYDFYLKIYNDSIHKWLNSRNNKFIRQISGCYYYPDLKWYYCSWEICVWNPKYLPDTVKFVNNNLLSTTERRTIRSIDAMEQVKEGKYAIKSGLLQPGDSVYVSIGISRSPLYNSVIKFIDLRNPDDNRHSVIATNDTLRIEAWLNPRDKRLANLAKVYGRMISKRLAAMKERAKRDDEEAYEYRNWTDLMIIPAKQ